MATPHPTSVQPRPPLQEIAAGAGLVLSLFIVAGIALGALAPALPEPRIPSAEAQPVIHTGGR